MSSNIRQAILKTLLYADVFNCALTKDQVWKFLIKDFHNSFLRKEFNVTISKKIEHVVNSNGYYAVSEKNIAITGERKKESRKKQKMAKRIILFLSCIPTIQCIGISGALAMENCEKDDDIDLFIVVKKNTIWLSRLLLLILLQMLGRRRKKNDQVAPNKVCLNMLIDETYLTLCKQNLYIAHEITQLVPVFERNNTYQKFLKANRWVTTFLPNSVPSLPRVLLYETTRKSSFNDKKINFSSMYVLNYISKQFQLWYMEKNRKSEIVSDYLLSFHPFDYQTKILNEYNKRLERYL